VNFLPAALLRAFAGRQNDISAVLLACVAGGGRQGRAAVYGLRRQIGGVAGLWHPLLPSPRGRSPLSLLPHPYYPNLMTPSMRWHHHARALYLGSGGKNGASWRLEGRAGAPCARQALRPAAVPSCLRFTPWLVPESSHVASLRGENARGVDAARLLHQRRWRRDNVEERLHRISLHRSYRQAPSLNRDNHAVAASWQACVSLSQ